MITGDHKDTAVAIGLMANAGIKGEKAGTALRSMLTRLSAPPKECASAMDALGISITNTDGTMKPLNEIMGDLRKSFDGLGEAEQAQYAKQIAGQEAMSGLLSIVNAAPEDFDKLTKAVNDSNGAAAKMSETMQDNLEGDMTKLGSKMEGVQIALYEKFEPALRKGTEVLNKLLDAVNFVVDHSTEFITAITAMGASIAVYVAYTTAIKIMKERFHVFKHRTKSSYSSTMVTKCSNECKPNRNSDSNNCWSSRCFCYTLE